MNKIIVMIIQVKLKNMKKGAKRIVAALLLCICIAGLPAQKATAQVGVSVSFQTFYDDLSPYGEWVDAPEYGYVWVPSNVGSDFRPYYSRGHWVMTGYGNTWVSDYDWGWAPFHYGRWTYDDYYGWVWIPGSEWAPAWVSWRYNDSYCGWAPLSPGISIGVSFTNYSCPNDWWVFVGPQYLYRPDYYHYWRGPRYNTEIINRTTIINNVYVNHGNNARYNYGPRPDFIQRVTHRPVPQYRIASASRPGAARIGNNTVSMYHPPTVRPMSGARPAPNHLVAAPRPIGRPAAVTNNARPAFHTQLQRGEIRPGNVPAQQGRPQMQQQGRPMPNMNMQQQRGQQMQQQRQQQMQQQREQQMQQQRGQQIQQERQQQMQQHRAQQMQQQRGQQMQQERQQQMQQQRSQQMQMQRQQQMQQQRGQQMQQERQQQMQQQRAQQMQQQRSQQMQMQRQQQMQQQRGQQMQQERQQQMQMQQRQQQMQRPQPQMERPQPQQERPQMEGGHPGGGGEGHGRR